ncbi:MAG: flagellar biosynthesis anti-sigma factor FlgM [Spirochaetaceae bacterium]|jgi:negative regulator of flagellin synthesis FlgM|nr:flagellar biosynthesis anti-sigma factor FlgM [Spirochaetaceae bacterium]
MTVDRIGSIDPIQPGKKTGRNSHVSPHEKADSIAFSSEAVEKGDLYRAMELVSSASDIREERIAELRQKINDPAYLNDTLLEATADRIMAVFGL